MLLEASYLVDKLDVYGATDAGPGPFASAAVTPARVHEHLCDLCDRAERSNSADCCQRAIAFEELIGADYDAAAAAVARHIDAADAAAAKKKSGGEARELVWSRLPWLRPAENTMPEATAAMLHPHPDETMFTGDERQLTMMRKAVLNVCETATGSSTAHEVAQAAAWLAEANSISFFAGGLHADGALEDCRLRLQKHNMKSYISAMGRKQLDVDKVMSNYQGWKDNMSIVSDAAAHVLLAQFLDWPGLEGAACLVGPDGAFRLAEFHRLWCAFVQSVESPAGSFAIARALVFVFLRRPARPSQIAHCVAAQARNAA